MYNQSHKDFACILSMLEAIEKIEGYTAKMQNADAFYEDQRAFDATLMNFIVIGEMAEKLSEAFRLETQEQIDWLKIRGFRNIIAHNYFGVDAEEVWQIIQNYLPRLKENIQRFTS